MTNTIELLERIGQDAALRHASGDELARALTVLQASDGLRRAAVSGDSGYLMAELGPRETQTPQIPIQSNAPWGEEEDESGHADEEQDGNEPNPEP
jgi:hypothetical protein